MRTPLVLSVLLLSACGGSGGRNQRDLLFNAGLDFALTGNEDLATDICSEKARLVYLVDADGTLSSFEPLTKQFLNIGKVNCPGEMAGSTNSMAIDHNAVAWLNYQSGNVYRVDTTTLDCTATSFKPSPSGFTTFGMGFSANTVGVMDETLFIAGGYGLGSDKLGTLDTSTMVASSVGNLPSWPELTGTGDAKLYGFFPDATKAKIAEIDKSTGALGTTYPLPELNGTQEAWAFAFWGGDFWIFLKRSTDTSTHVWHLDIFDGGMNVTDAVPNTGRQIVGAGVSICAPITIG